MCKSSFGGKYTLGVVIIQSLEQSRNPLPLAYLVSKMKDLKNDSFFRTLGYNFQVKIK